MAMIGLLAACSPAKEQTACYNVIPRLAEIVETSGEEGFTLTGSTVITYPADNDTLKTDAAHLQGYLEQLTGHKLSIREGVSDKNAINLTANLDAANPEAYRLTVNSENISIDGASSAGTFYGIQTLRKSIPEAMKSNVLFPAVTINDQPRFSYRGAHFDVSRHFFPADSVKTFIDMLALHNINKFHWHLTDDQGWRVEIKSRPELAEKGSKRSGTVIGHNSGVYDTIPVEGFYTQDQIRDIVKYAADRHITVIPEIDLPGHMLGALTAYPELGCTGGPYEVWQQWGVSTDVLCAGNDSIYTFLDDVMGEIVELFPSEYIHVGGDECPKDNWKKCPKCQAKIVELGIVGDAKGTQEEKLQSHVIHHVSNFLTSHGKKMIGWDETLEGGLAPGAVIMSWRGEEGGIEAAKQGHDAIMTPTSYFYFDYYQTLDQQNEPIAIGGYVPLEKVYSYEPISADFNEEEAKHIIGVQANLWTEYMPTFSQVQYMELPRMAALSEVQWSNAPKDYDNFMERLPQMVNQYIANNYNFSSRGFDVRETVQFDTIDHTLSVELSALGTSPIFYTLDGTEPTPESTKYDGPVKIDRSTVFKAIAVSPFNKWNVVTDSFTFNKATARKISLEAMPAKKYSADGPRTLVDGQFGANGFNTGRWLGFFKDDAIATIDFEEPLTISKVSVNTNVDTWDDIFDAQNMKVLLSDDGKTWREVASLTNPMPERHYKGLYNNTLTFEPQEARYAKIALGTIKSMPEWHGAKGKPGFLFIDEIVIE